MKDYEVIAPIYDKIMSHVDYPMWASYLMGCYDQAEHVPKFTLELAAGTGSLACYLKEDIPRIVGSDLHFNMVNLQRQDDFQHRLTFDMCRIPFKDSSFDSIFCLYDSVNYLTEDSQLEDLLTESYRVLEKEGVFVFDTVTERNSKEYFSDSIDFEEFPEGDLVREAFYDEDHRMQYTKFLYYQKSSDDSFKKFEEEHAQKIWPLLQIEETAIKAGYTLIGKYDGFSFEDIDEETDRVHWVFKKISK